MVTTTPLLALIDMEASQALPETRFNETVRWLEAAGGGRMIVKDRGLTDPTALTPSEGDGYLVPTGGAGAWLGKDGKLALLINGAWSYATPRDGFAIEVLDEDSSFALRGGAWVATDGSGGVTPNKAVTLLVTDPNGSAITTGNGKTYYRVPSTLNGLNLVAVAAAVTTASSSGAVSVQVHNLTQAADMLTTNVTIDASETDSSTAATPAVIDTGNDDVATGNMLRIDIDGAGTGAKGLILEMQFA